jgi:alanine racemase
MLTWLEISKNNLVHNFKQFRKIVSKKIKIMAVVKSNAYGHGMIECAKIFEKAGADYLGVINLEEALELRKNGLKNPIFILSFWEVDKDKIIKAIKGDIEFPVYTEQQIEFLAKISQKIGKKAKIHLKIDTGASRIGVLPENALNLAQKCLKSPYLELKGVFTHFAKSEAENQAFTNKQAKKLLEIKEKLMGIPNFPKDAIFHAGCTASTLNNVNTFFDMVRIGLGLYGLYPSIGNLTCELRPAMTWKTRIIQVKELPKGTFVGYDCTYQSKQKIKIAILPIGYWDGYDRKLSNQGEVLIQGRRVPIIGRVCMNLTMMDVSKIKNATVGDEVVLLGQQKSEQITAEKMGGKIGTINYEVVTKINQSLPRIYLSNEQ